MNSVFSSRKMGGDVVKGVDGGMIISASCKYHFIRVHKKLVQHPSITISIPVTNMNNFAILCGNDKTSLV